MIQRRCPLQHPFRPPSFRETLDGSFSAVSTPIFVTKDRFPHFFEIYKICILSHRSKFKIKISQVGGRGSGVGLNLSKFCKMLSNSSVWLAPQCVQPLQGALVDDSPMIVQAQTLEAPLPKKTRRLERLAHVRGSNIKEYYDM